MLKHILNSLCLDADTGNEGGGTDTQDNQDTKDETLTTEQIQKMIQSEADKVRTEYSKKYKALEAEKEELLKAKMNDEEKKKFEMDKLQKELQSKEQAILQRELNLKAVDLLTESGLDLEFRQFVIGSDEETTVAKVETLKKVWQNAINKAVESKFKENGRQVDNTTKQDVDVDNMSMEQFAEHWNKNNRKYQ